MIGRIVPRVAGRWLRRGFAAALVIVPLVAARSAQAQIIQPAVGGISIDQNGVLAEAAVADVSRLRDVREKALAQVPAELAQPSELRKISLRRLAAALAEHNQSGQPLPEEIRYLAGLQRVRYVLVYPDQNDIVLAGYAEGWKVGPRGAMVGVTTEQPVAQIDDLLVALRSTLSDSPSVISCSIDPTAEGLQRLQQAMKQVRNIGPDPARTINGIEETLGPQTITVAGVPASSHFARVMVAADYRMKRLAMKFEPAPVKGLPSFLDMIAAGATGMQNMLPRWWLATDYDSLLTDGDGLVYELRGQGVKAMAEDDFLAANGQRQQSGKASAQAQRWADNMTENFEELARRDSIFGQLRTCMDLAVVAALVAKERLDTKAGCDLAALTDEKATTVESFPAPREVPSKASFVRKGSKFLISASGGVQINPWTVVDKKEVSDSLDETRRAAQAGGGSNWWWD